MERHKKLIAEAIVMLHAHNRNVLHFASLLIKDPEIPLALDGSTPALLLVIHANRSQLPALFSISIFVWNIYGATQIFYVVWRARGGYLRISYSFERGQWDSLSQGRAPLILLLSGVLQFPVPIVLYFCFETIIRGEIIQGDQIPGVVT